MDEINVDNEAIFTSEKLGKLFDDVDILFSCMMPQRTAGLQSVQSRKGWKLGFRNDFIQNGSQPLEYILKQLEYCDIALDERVGIEKSRQYLTMASPVLGSQTTLAFCKESGSGGRCKRRLMLFGNERGFELTYSEEGQLLNMTSFCNQRSEDGPEFIPEFQVAYEEGGNRRIIVCNSLADQERAELEVVQSVELAELALEICCLTSKAFTVQYQE